MGSEEYREPVIMDEAVVMEVLGGEGDQQTIDHIPKEVLKWVTFALKEILERIIANEKEGPQ